MKSLRLFDGWALNRYWETCFPQIYAPVHGDVLITHAWRPGWVSVSTTVARQLRSLQAEGGRVEGIAELSGVVAELEALGFLSDEPMDRRSLSRKISAFPAQQSLLEWHALLEAVAPRPLRTIVEIGSCTAGTTYQLAQLLEPGGRLIVVDPFLTGSAFDSWPTERIQTFLSSFMGPGQSVTLIRDDSHRVRTMRQVSHAAGGAVDLLFIDGDHGFGGALADYLLYGMLVPLDGFIALHDINGVDPAAEIHAPITPKGSHIDVGDLWRTIRADAPGSIDLTVRSALQSVGSSEAVATLAARLVDSPALFEFVMRVLGRLPNGGYRAFWEASAVVEREPFVGERFRDGRLPRSLHELPPELIFSQGGIGVLRGEAVRSWTPTRPLP